MIPSITSSPTNNSNSSFASEAMKLINVITKIAIIVLLISGNAHASEEAQYRWNPAK